MHAGIYGFLYMNVKGRGPHGIVDPSDYERLRGEIAQKLRDVKTRNPDGDTISVFAEILIPEELYKCSREDNPNLPDLLLVPQPGLAVVRKIRGSQPVRWCSDGRLEGTHRVEGILAMGGEGICRGKRVDANIVDITPTVLAALGLRVPLDMEGKLITKAFVEKLISESEPPVKKTLEEREEVYSDEERKLLEERLSDLGYLE